MSKELASPETKRIHDGASLGVNYLSSNQPQERLLVFSPSIYPEKVLALPTVSTYLVMTRRVSSLQM